MASQDSFRIEDIVLEDIRCRFPLTHRTTTEALNVESEPPPGLSSTVVVATNAETNERIEVYTLSLSMEPIMDDCLRGVRHHVEQTSSNGEASITRYLAFVDMAGGTSFYKLKLHGSS